MIYMPFSMIFLCDYSWEGVHTTSEDFLHDEEADRTKYEVFPFWEKLDEPSRDVWGKEIEGFDLQW